MRNNATYSCVVRYFFLSSVMLLLMAANAHSQSASLMWIDASPRDSCGSPKVPRRVFGNYIFGTYGVDWSIGEASCPPSLPPIGHDAYWYNIPGRSASEFGYLRCGPDIRGWQSESQVDTFQLNFFTDCEWRRPFVFFWPDSAYLAARCDSVFLLDIAGDFSPINMFRQDSFRVPLADSTVIPFLLIIKYGAKLVDIIESTPEKEVVSPSHFKLLQNYPNPFNPATEIRFEVPVSGFVSLKVFDILGREVATLVHEQKPPGSYSVQWDAVAQTSGVYYYRLATPNSVEVRKMMLIK